MPILLKLLTKYVIIISFMHQVRYMKSSASESKPFQSHPKGEIPRWARQKDVLNSMYQVQLMKSSASEPDLSPLLVKLYWLLISYRVVFKLLLLVLKALNAKMVLVFGRIVSVPESFQGTSFKFFRTSFATKIQNLTIW